MQTAPRKIWFILVCVLTISTGCPEESQNNAGSQTSSDPEPAAIAGGPMRTIEVSDEKVALGKKHFTMCAGCHGPDAEGRVGQAPRLAAKSFMSAASDAYLFKTIKTGRPGTTMIAWAGTLSDADIEATIAYLRSLQPTEPVELDESPLKGDVATGEKLFGEICAMCHGVNGAGYQETANGTGIGRKGFVEEASNGFIRHMARNGKEGTAMKPMQGAKTSVANLSDIEIDSIIKYLRESAW